MTSKPWLYSAFSKILAFCLLIGVLANTIWQRNWPTFVGTLFLTTLILWVIYHYQTKINSLSIKTTKKIVYCSLVFMLIMQLMILSFLPVTVYHDPLRVLDQAARMATGLPGWHITYFFRYVLNVQITFLVFLWLKFFITLGFSVNFAIHFLSIIVLDGFIYLILNTTEKVSGKPLVILSTLGFLVYSPFAYTYYLQVFYTDLPAMLVLAYLFRSLLLWKQKNYRQKIITGFLLVLAAMLGTLLKSNMVVILPAILIIALVQYLKTKKILLLKPLALIFLGVCLAFPASKLILTAANFQPESRYQFPVTAWMAMGLNSRSNGIYADKDVMRNIQEPNLTQRNQNNKEVIIKRVKQLGILGLIKLWVNKLGILTNVADIQTWYNGGFKEAPGWFLNSYRFYLGLINILYQSVTIVLFILVIKRLLTSQITGQNQVEQVFMLLVLTLLGYLSFHIFLWEVNARYGQVFVPILLILMAIPVKQKLVVSPVKRTLSLLLILGTISGIMMSINNAKLVQKLPWTIMVAAQRAQLSTQYGAKPEMVLPNEKISQRVKLNGKVNYLGIQVRQNSNLKVSLFNLSTKESFTCFKKGEYYVYNKTLNPGNYQIKITNLSKKGQPIDIIEIPHYQMAPYPLDSQGRISQDHSLIYFFRWT